MTPSQMYRSYLLAGEAVIVQLPTRQDANYLLQLLRTEKYRSSKQLANLGMSEVDPMIGKVLVLQVLEVKEDGVVVQISSQAARGSGKLVYTVLPTTAESIGAANTTNDDNT